MVMQSRPHRWIQFVSDELVEQIAEGRKTVSVVHQGELDQADGECEDPLVVGEYYDVYISDLIVRATIRILAIPLLPPDRENESLKSTAGIPSWVRPVIA